MARTITTTFGGRTLEITMNKDAARVMADGDLDNDQKIQELTKLGLVKDVTESEDLDKMDKGGISKGVLFLEPKGGYDVSAEFLMENYPLTDEEKNNIIKQVKEGGFEGKEAQDMYKKMVMARMHSKYSVDQIKNKDKMHEGGIMDLGAYERFKKMNGL